MQTRYDTEDRFDSAFPPGIKSSADSCLQLMLHFGHSIGIAFSYPSFDFSFELGAIEVNLVHFHDDQLQGDGNNLDEERRQFGEKSFPKGGDRIEIRGIVGGHLAKG